MAFEKKSFETLSSVFRLRSTIALFLPIPKVQSAIVRMTPLKQKMVDKNKEVLFSTIVAAAFSQRRKTLRNTLQDYLKPEDFEVLKIEPRLRAENLSIAQFLAITNHLIG